MIMTDQIWRAV